MGSPGFGLPTLQALRSAGHEIGLVVSQPDRPAGRSRRLTPPPIAAYAREQGLALHQPERLRDEAALEPIRRAEPRAIVVAAYGLLLPRRLLELPPLGCLNVHPSLLPRYRGATPIQAALLAGDRQTGVTIIRLVSKMDAGPILAQETVPIGPDDDALTLEETLANLGAQLLVRTLQAWDQGALQPREQDESAATYCQRFEREQARLDWQRPADELERVVRAFRGRSDAYTTWHDRPLKVLAARALPAAAGGLSPGVVGEQRTSAGRRLVAGTGKGLLWLEQVALAGRPPTSGEALLNGYRELLGARLGDEASVREPQDSH